MVTTWERRGRAASLLLALFFCCTLSFTLGAARAAAFSISGQVLDDTNLNHQVDPADRPLAFVEVHLLNGAAALLAVAITDGQGRYQFDQVAPGGSYLVTTVPPFATVAVGVQPGPGAVAAGVNAIFIRSFVADRDYPGNNFLQRQFQVVSPVTPETPNTISGQVINDLNGNGAVDPGEPGLGGASLTLVSAAGVLIATSSSAATGEFTFVGLANGDYFLSETDPPGATSTNAIPGIGGVRLDANTLRITTAAGATQTGGQQFLDRSVAPGGGNPGSGGGAGPYHIEGFVIDDTSGNGIVGRGDQPLVGVTVTLKDGSGVPLAVTQTSSVGKFEFNGLASGVYIVTETDPPGYQSADAQPGTGGVKIDENNVRLTVSGGVVSYAGTVFLDHLATAPPGAGSNQILGSVFNDANGNGVVDGGEGPIANVPIALRDAANNLILSTLTSVTGSFTFSGVASGTYTLVETDLPGSTSVAAIPGIGGQVIDANTLRVTTVQGIVTYAGFTFLDRQLAAPGGGGGADNISGVVINDANGNGVADPGELPLAGAVVTLQDSSGAPAGSATTGADGSFLFANLGEGTYTVIEVDPAGYFSTGTVAGVGGQALDDNSIRVTTVAGLTSYPGQMFLDQAGAVPQPAAASIFPIYPTSGGPGSTITLSGRGFGSGPIQVLFGSTPGTVLNSSGVLNSVVALVPDLPAGPVQITLVNAAGTSNAVGYTVTAPGPGAALAALFLPAFNELNNQKSLAQVVPAMEVVIAQSLGFAQNQAVSGNIAGARNTLRGLIVRIGRGPADVTSPAAKSALVAAINTLLAQL